MSSPLVILTFCGIAGERLDVGVTDDELSEYGPKPTLLYALILKI